MQPQFNYVSFHIALLLFFFVVAQNEAFVTFSRKPLLLIKSHSEKVSCIACKCLQPKPISSIVSLRGGFNDFNSLRCSILEMQEIWSFIVTNPENLFNAVTFTLVSASLIAKFYTLKHVKSTDANTKNVSKAEDKPAGIVSLQKRFLFVFWLLRMADWLQGPYFYEVYTSKFINKVPLPLDMVSKLFLVGFATTGICGPWMGGIVDSVGRKTGTLLYTLLYTMGALSTRSSTLWVLVLGRFAGGLGTSLLFSAPEAWLVAEHQRHSFDTGWLAQTFSWAFAGDSIVAIAAGQLASWAVKHVSGGGPTGPFILSVLFLLTAAVLIVPLWAENRAQKEVFVDTTVENRHRNSNIFGEDLSEALTYLMRDKRLLLLGAVQALFEGAMYIFVLQWPPAVRAIFSTTSQLDVSHNLPYGNIFSSFMASCFLGSTVFNILQTVNSNNDSKKNVKKLERDTAIMLGISCLSMVMATYFGFVGRHLGWLMGSLLLFEACVGMYFPSIGTLRSKYIPDAYRSVIMNCFGVPLNLIVVMVFLNIKKLGTLGALSISSGALMIAAVCMMKLAALTRASSEKED